MLTLEQNLLIQKWTAAKSHLEVAKETEMNLRKQVTDLLFPNPVKGTQRQELGQGYNIKLVYNLNYKLGDVELRGQDGEKIPVRDQVEITMDEIEKSGNEGKFLVDRLIKTSYDLSVSEYNKLDENNPTHKAIKKLIDDILITSPKAPTLELETPKAN